MIEIDRLTVIGPSGSPVLDDVSAVFESGSRIAIVGGSGSGKTTVARALLWSFRPGLQPIGGRVMADGVELATMTRAQLGVLRRTQVSYLPQDPAITLTPSRRVRAQVAELLPPGERDVRTPLERVGLPTDADFLRRLPHQLSGGQRQRLALARAIARRPSFLVLDEPTTGLDPVARERVVTELAQLGAALDATLVVITHDLGVAARLADRVLRLENGRVVATGSPADVLAGEPARAGDPRRAAGQRADAVAPAGAKPVVLTVSGLTAGYGRGTHGGAHAVVASRDLDLELRRGTATALLGASGAGKTTILRAIAGHHPGSAGTISLEDRALAQDIGHRSRRDRRRIQLVGQSAARTLNPRRTVAQIIGRSLAIGGLSHAAARRSRCGELLEIVGLDPALCDRRPGSLSGGQQQRVAMARALSTEPDVLLCDEVTASLDPDTERDLLALLAALRHDRGLALLFVTHDLALARSATEETVVLHEARVCERGPTDRVLGAPRHDWTRALVDAAAAHESALKINDSSAVRRNSTAVLAL